MSIRELTEQDRESTIQFLKQEPSFNLFQIGDIYHYGFEREFQQVWGDFDSSGELRAVLLRYYGNYLPYAPKEFNIDGFAEIMEKAGNLQLLSATDEMVGYFETFPRIPFDWTTKKTFYFAELDRIDLIPEISGLDYPMRKMTIEDVHNVAQLHDSIEEFNLAPMNVDFQRHSLSIGSSRGYVIEENNQIVAMAQTTAENPYAAMIVGVSTAIPYREKGLASTLMSRLCHDLLSEGKKVCLFYDNPAAGNIYKRLGFKDIGLWGVVKRKVLEDLWETHVWK